jgi:hypothetical protein
MISSVKSITSDGKQNKQAAGLCFVPVKAIILQDEELLNLYLLR